MLSRFAIAWVSRGLKDLILQSSEADTVADDKMSNIRCSQLKGDTTSAADL